ncbi:MAG: putative phosphatase [Bacteroidetes bacterium]|nr:putative phosphatase [Bacteroidota bacterium]
MKNYKYILFDLDGTLTDPQEGIINSIQYALKRFGIKKEDHELIHFIGPPLHHSFQEIFGTEEKAYEAVAVYREYYAEKGIFENLVYSGINELLNELSSMNKVMFVATSKPTFFAKQIVEHYKIDHHFKAVVGSNLDGSHTDKKEIIQTILDMIPEADKKEMLMIGDRKFDIIGAGHHNIDCAAVTFGYGSIDELQNEKPTYIINTIEELGKLF